MKKIIKLILVFFLTIGTVSLFADFIETEPNENCAQSEVLTTLNGATTHKIENITGTIVSTTWDNANNKPYYDMDYFHFAPGTSGEVKITANGNGNMYFWIGKTKCDVWDVAKYFGKSITKTFKVAANQRVDIKAMCRWARTYNIRVEFTPDHEEPELPKISINNAETTEGDSGSKEMRFKVSLNKASDKTVMVDFSTSDVSAKAGEDYEEEKASVEFMPGETQKEIVVNIFGDTLKEGNERFNLNLSNPMNASLANSKGIGTIIDDDGDTPQPVKFDTEPNNDCDHSEVISALEGATEEINFVGKGTIRVNQEGEGAEARDYYHFTVANDGTLEIVLKSNLPMWFAISTKGCFVPWVDSTRWNIQRGVADNVNKTIEVKAGDRIDILALSYSNKDYEVDIKFTPSGTPPKKADLIISKSDEKDPVKVGENIVYTIEVENIGEAAADGVVVRDTLPNGVTFVNALGNNFNCSENNGVVTCEYSSSFGVGDKAQIAITVKAPDNEGEITNVAEVSTDTSESDLTNNRAEEKTEVQKAMPGEKTLIVPIKEAYDDAIEFEMIETSGYVYTGGGISIAKDYLANDMGVLKNELGKFRIRSGFRFEDINLSKDSKIKEAYIEFTAQKKDFDIDVVPTSFEIFAENMGDSPAFAKGPTYDLSNRIKVDAKVEWNDVEAWEDGKVYKTPDIKVLLEKVMKRNDWESGNPITIFVEPSKECTDEDECYRRAYDFDTDPSKAPKLIIKYEE